MIASLKSALSDAFSLARLLREAAARVKAAEARAEQAEQHFRVLSELHCRELAAHQTDVRQLRRERDDEEAQAIEALRQRDVARETAAEYNGELQKARATIMRVADERDAARASLRKALADIEEAQRIAGAKPQDSPQALVGGLMAEIGKLNSDIKAHRGSAREWFADLAEARLQRDEARREAERLSAELRAAKSRGGGRS